MTAPNFQLQDIKTGEPISLEKYKEKAILLTFWVSWCPDSQRDLPNKEQLYRSMNTDDLVILMVHVSGREGTAEAGEKYYDENNFTFPCAVDDGTKVYDRYQCMSVPTTFLLNSNHEIVARFNDKASFQEMIQAIGNVLNQ
ncbi:TlpA family protein disulfide reductase [Bacillus shivajii]|uniref:TlpA family protein disulfide reductase n=1 Tax=Bacillus shivajii TaxID=1983719 RepID=UPI001CFBF48D|nr:TlpA disulfide reductase family protein [Bacillus shivajii]UCZ54838.1 TlpA family protein disulfide reductase [Bacillus shivajii]